MEEAHDLFLHHFEEFVILGMIEVFPVRARY
jgi:hypothetical protein